MNNREFIRSFFAIDIPQTLRESLFRSMEPLYKNKKIIVHWKKMQNLHITLQFMGNFFLEDLSELMKNIRHEIQDISSFEIELNEFELFPDSDHPRFFSLSLMRNEKLIVLVDHIRKAILKMNYPVEAREYRAHITLGKIQDKLPKNFSFEKMRLPEDKKFLVREIVLYQSQVSEEGSRYIPLERVVL